MLLVYYRCYKLVLTCLVN